MIPEYALVQVLITDPHNSIKLNLDTPPVKKATEIMQTITGEAPLLVYSGGGLPIVSLIDEVLRVPQVLAPLANEDCAMHGTNENFELTQLERSLTFSQAFLVNGK